VKANNMMEVLRPRRSVSAEAYGNWNKKGEYVAKVYPKSDEQKERLGQVLSKSFMFNVLEAEDRTTVLNAMKEVKSPDGMTIISQGDDGDCLFVIESGTLECWKVMSKGEEAKLVKTCEAGDVFGELALLYNAPRAATVKAKGESVLWQLDRDTFNHIVKDRAQKRRDTYEQFVRNVKLFESLDSYEMSIVAECLAAEEFGGDEYIITEGELGYKMYFLEKAKPTRQNSWKRARTQRGCSPSRQPAIISASWRCSGTPPARRISSRGRTAPRCCRFLRTNSASCWGRWATS